MKISHLKMLTVILLLILSFISPQTYARPTPIKPPELFIFSDAQNSVHYSIEEKDKAVTALFDSMNVHEPSEKPKPIFVYIHGRALGARSDYDKEPQKSRSDVIPELFSRYHASKVLMFHWPHRGRAIQYTDPANDAKESGSELADLLVSINQTAKERTPNGPLILISHSMGAIVLEEAITHSPLLQLNNFHTVAIFSPAGRYDNSWNWLSKINSPSRYVFSNNHDPMFRAVHDILGKCDAECLNERQRADGMVYIDISPLRLRHRYFVFGNQLSSEKSILAENIVQPILTGEKPKFEGSQPYSAKNIYVVHDN